MQRKWIGLLGAAWLVLAMGMPVQATEEGSLRVVPVWGGRQIPGGQVSISRAGDKTEGGYRITDGLADWIVSEEEIFSGSWTRWLEEQSVVIRTCSPESGTGAFFEGLPEGLYLVQQKEAAPGFLSFQPFLLSIPQGQQWVLEQEVPLIRDEESPKTGDRHVPLVGAMGLGFSAAVLMVLVDQRKK